LSLLLRDCIGSLVVGCSYYLSKHEEKGVDEKVLKVVEIGKFFWWTLPGSNR
jgi:hypothetical protein